MPLDTIYLTRHGHRLNWTIDHRTGTYKPQFPTPTGNPADPALTSHGVRQSYELAVHIARPDFHPKPFRIYSSPFYRCLQTIQPSVEELKRKHQETKSENGTGAKVSSHGQIEPTADLDVRLENGLAEWFGPTTWFHHPSHPEPSTMRKYFPTLLHATPESKYAPILRPSTRGETIAQLHNRVATALEGIIADVDAEINELEAGQSPQERTSKSLLICAHAAPLIAMGRALTGNMPEDSSVEDFYVFTAGLSTFRRRNPSGSGELKQGEGILANGTELYRSNGVPEWENGKGVGGGWDCVSNGDCSFLSGGAERGWHFNGEEGFDTNSMTPSEPPVGTTKL
ncbi:Histidine phosphatase superfamily clade-1 [Penicillium argentinense]|uniref:Histidine phosphatase superfamily clade-1 n=1 Tax=Penicillium argentinense TaxID=1131581 RepID=A0A9W9EWQ1_9EURO|nr:Histidine phosphatase superfamily clade-1 [Penicillium argentinense]KAJ5089260.1 Histidine phosphatase superfamily clade-1 [Penicillium argentinense]